LSAQIRILVSDPIPGRLEAAQAVWREARSDWSRVQAYTFGPVMELRIPSLVDWWPIDEAKIQRALTRPTISADDVRETFAADQRGFSALEQLLFSDSDSLLARLASSDDAYGQYLTALADVITDAIRQASDDWSGDYGEAFSGSGDRAISENLAIADLVRVPVFLTESVGDMQLGVALGITKAEADPTVIPEGHAGVGVNDLEQNLRGIQDTYLGGSDGLGVSDLIAQLSEETDQRMRDALSHAIDMIAALKSGGQSLNELLETDPDAVAQARDAIKAVQVILNTEIVSLLGVTIGFSDNDGDS
jgi:predicted lipoprotein